MLKGTWAWSKRLRTCMGRLRGGVRGLGVGLGLELGLKELRPNVEEGKALGVGIVRAIGLAPNTY